MCKMIVLTRALIHPRLMKDLCLPTELEFKISSAEFISLH